MTALPTPGGADTCVAAGGTWANNTGTTAVPAGYMNLGGTLIPYSTVMLVGGLAALLIVMKKK